MLSQICVAMFLGHSELDKCSSMYRQNSNTMRTLMCNKIADHSNVSGSIACRRCSNYIFILDLTPSFNGLGKDNRKTRRETFEC